MTLVLGCLVAIAGNANADYYETRNANCDMSAMRAALDRATADGRAVITVVRCDDAAARPVPRVRRAPRVVSSDCGFNRVINREYFVRETVQSYRPVMTYVPYETYTRVRPVCDEFGC